MLLVSSTVVTHTLRTGSDDAPAAVGGAPIQPDAATAGPSAMQQGMVLRAIEEQQQNSSRRGRLLPSKRAGEQILMSSCIELGGTQ
jgi:hypothetical protein